MTTQQPGDDGAMLFAPPPPKRKRSPVGAIVIALVLAVTVGGAIYGTMRQSAIKKAMASAWVLPEGVANLSEVNECLADRNLPCAEADMLAYLKKYPDDAHTTALLAITLTRDGRHKESLYYYRKAESMGISTYDIHANYARSLEVMGDIDHAIVQNQAALNISPTLVDVRGSLADQLVKRGKGKEALDLLQGFDRKLESEGYPTYFGPQIRKIELGLGGEYAKAALANDQAAPPVAAPGQSLVKGVPAAGTLVVPVSIDGSATRPFAVDSGASLISMPLDDAQPYLKSGLIKPGDYRGSRPMQLANGSMVVSRIYTLRSVKVGDREVHDVLAAVYPGHGPRLLGQSFLKRFKSWSIDNRARTLVLTD